VTVVVYLVRKTNLFWKDYSPVITHYRWSTMQTDCRQRSRRITQINWPNNTLWQSADPPQNKSNVLGQIRMYYFIIIIIIKTNVRCSFPYSSTQRSQPNGLLDIFIIKVVLLIIIKLYTLAHKYKRDSYGNNAITLLNLA